MEEIWKDIKGYEGLYQVSNLGNVKSLKRKYVLREKILKKSVNKNGYHCVGLSKNGELKPFYVHSLVSMTFLNHNNKINNLITDHINNVKADNRVCNLQLISSRENTSKDRKNGTSKYTGVCSFIESKKVKWVSAIRINGKIKYLGRFKNEYEAHLAYQNALNNI